MNSLACSCTHCRKVCNTFRYKSCEISGNRQERCGRFSIETLRARARRISARSATSAVVGIQRAFPSCASWHSWREFLSLRCACALPVRHAHFMREISNDFYRASSGVCLMRKASECIASAFAQEHEEESRTFQARVSLCRMSAAERGEKFSQWRGQLAARTKIFLSATLRSDDFALLSYAYQGRRPPPPPCNCCKVM